MIVFALAGCTSPGKNISHNGQVAVERIPSSSTQITWADAYQNGDYLTVRGAMRRSDHSTYPLKMHIHMMLLDKDRRILTETAGSDINIPAYRARRIIYEHFEIKLPFNPPPGTVIRLTCKPAEIPAVFD